MPHDASQIIPLHLGTNAAALKAAQALRARGLLVTAVRPPSVPEGTARLRLSVTLAHTDDDLEHAACVLVEVLKPARLVSAPSVD